MMDQFKNLRIAVVGSGAVGSYYGGKLAALGCDVHFLMRSDLDAVKLNGLTLRESSSEIRIPEVHACASSEEIGPCDLVLIALKTTSNGALETLIPPLLKPDTVLVTLQNGLGNEEYLSELFGKERVMGGLCFVCLNRVAPGVIEHYGHGTLSIGEFCGEPKTRTHDLVAAFREAGVDARTVECLALERWKKLVWNVPFNGLSIVAGNVTVDVILSDDGLRSLTRNLMEEIIGAAAKLGYVLPSGLVDHQIERTLPMGAYKPSSLIDFMQGRAVEVESIWG
ncbi:MAG: 2-dehydropantoate 2-reductase, partial [Verrucomicrobiota bacterium]